MGTCVSHTAFPGRAPTHPQRTLTQASQDNRTKGSRGDPARLSLGGNPAFCSSSQRGQIFILPRLAGGEQAGGVAPVPPGWAEEE